MRTIKMFVSVMISGLIVRCCAVPTSDDVQLRLEGVRGDVPSKLVASGQEIPIYTGLYTAIQHYTVLYIVILVYILAI